MRKAFADTLVEMAKFDNRLMVVTGDMGFGVFDEFQHLYPERYVNVGIAEAQLINFCAGLALEGFRPFAYSIASFITARAYEQIRFSVGYHELPVTIVGAGGGFIYSQAGPTHHAPDDVTLMRTIPGINILVPGTPSEVKALVKQILEKNVPCYLRLGRYGEDEVPCSSPIEIGKAREIIQGECIAICTVGDMLPKIYKSYQSAYSKTNSKPALYHFHTIRPVDTDTLDFIAKRFYELHIYEESTPNGGLFFEVLQWKNITGARIQVKRFGPTDEFVIGNPTREQLHARYGMNFDN